MDLLDIKRHTYKHYFNNYNAAGINCYKSEMQFNYD